MNIRKVITNILAVILLFIIFLVIITLRGATKNSPEATETATSTFVGPTSSPSGIKGPSGPPPTVPERR
jgi:predicted benzoate:H+ symporter BenE